MKAHSQFAEKVEVRPSAPEGAIDLRDFAASLKRCPDTNLSFSANCSGAEKVDVAFGFGWRSASALR